MSKLWISKAFSWILKIIFQFLFKTQPPKTLSAPGAMYTCAQGETDKRAYGGTRPHPSAVEGRGGDGSSGSHRRRGRRRRGHHHRDHHAKTVTLAQTAWSEELAIELTHGHGSLVARLIGGSTPSAMGWREKRHPSTGRAGWRECAHELRKNRSGREVSTERGPPVSSVGTCNTPRC
jgi:hypothetical protein